MDFDSLPGPSDPPRLAYYTTQAGAMSFESDKVRHFATQFIQSGDDVLNLCAGETDLPGNVDRNDVRDGVDAEFHHDVRDLFGVVDKQYDVVVYDPPFSIDQHQNTYDLPPELWPGYGEHIATGIETLLKPGGRAIQFGFHATIDPADATALYPAAIGTFQQLGRGYDWCACVAVKASETPSSPECSKAIAKVHPNPSERCSGDPSFDMTYQRDRTEALESTLASHILQQLDRPAGKTLALVWGDEPAAFESHFEARDTLVDEVVPYRGPRDRVITRSLGVGDKSGINIHPEDFRKHIPSLDYDTVVLWPPLAGWNWTVSYRGEECGYVRALKRSLDKLLGSNSTVYTVGRTMTGMRNAWDYEHEGVSIIDRVGEQECWYISKFSKPQTGFGEDDQVHTPIDNGYRDTKEPPHWISVSTRTTWDRHPALYVPCPDCGAHQNNHCVEGGEVVHLHPGRFDWLQDKYDQGRDLRWYRHRSHGTVSTVPNHDFDGVAAPSRTTNSKPAGQDTTDKSNKKKTTARTLGHYGSGESAT